MSKLWIVHRNPRRLAALARISGLEAPELSVGEPASDVFEDAPTPAALLLGLEGDFERELEFLHRHRDRLARTRRTLLAAPEDADEVQRLFGVTPDEILETTPSDRQLRALVISAVAHRNAESLAARRDRERISKRFAGWFGGVEIPGLLRALDPALARLPLLVRGVLGSGRPLVARYVDLFRNDAGGAPPAPVPPAVSATGGGTPTRQVASDRDRDPRDRAANAVLRLHAREIRDAEEIAERVARRRHHFGRPVETVWIDQIDALPVSVQVALAEWIRLDAAPTGGIGGPLRWIATAGPAGLRDPLEVILQNAFAPLELSIPSLVEHPQSLPDFAAYVATDWCTTVGDTPRQVSESAIAALEAHAWSGDRAAVESILRTTFAATPRNPIEESDLTLGHLDWSDLTSELAADPLSEEPASDALPDAFGSDVAPRSDAEGDALEDATFLTDEAGDAPPLPSVEAELESIAEDVREGFAAPAPDAGPQAGGTPDAEALADFERAFEEGLPGNSVEQTTGEPRRESSAERDLAPETARPELAAETDVSSQLSDEAFEMAGDAARAGGHTTAADERWRRLARSLSHEIRNPLVSIRTFAALLPEHFADPSFRERFTELVGRDVAQIDEVVTRLADVAEHETIEPTSVDVSALLERLLDARRDEIGRGRLLVLRELERDEPLALADARGLEVALAGLLDRALASLPERGDLFVATRRIDRAADGAPRLRVLLRHHNPELGAGDTSGLAELGAATNVLEYVLAETVVATTGGQLTIDSTDGQETLILVDLRTPDAA